MERGEFFVGFVNHGGERAGDSAEPEVGAGSDHASQARMHGELSHGPSGVGDVPVSIECAKVVEQTVVDVLAELKPGRNLYANVEFYAGVVMDHCGLPPELFTPTFASSRVIGWCANILEQAADNRIIRPSARYVGPPPPQPVPDPA